MGRRKKKRDTWREKLARLRRRLDIYDERELAKEVGVTVRTLRSWIDGRSEPAPATAKKINLMLGPERHRISRRSRRRAPVNVKELDYLGYLLLWREHLDDIRVGQNHWERSFAFGEGAGRGVRRRSRLWSARRKLGEDGRGKFPLERTATRESLDDDELSILATLVVDELRDLSPEEAPRVFDRAGPRSGGEALIDTVSSDGSEFVRKAQLLAPDGRLRASGLVECRGRERGILDARFNLAETARSELIEGVPEVALRRHASSLCRTVIPRVDLSSVILPDETRTRLDEALAFARHRAVLLDQWGFGNRIHYGTGVGLLFSGPPGCGKTLAAEALARELGQNLLIIDMARIMSMWVGQTSKHIVQVFDDAARGRAVLFLDEADGLLATRDMAARSWEIRNVNVLLQEIESYEGVIILATNNRPVLDSALERRVTSVIEFPRPGRPEREAIWRLHWPEQAPTDGEIDFAALAEHELTGGEIKKGVLAAAARVLNEKGPTGRIGQADLEAAARSVTAKEAVGFGRA